MIADSKAVRLAVGEQYVALAPLNELAVAADIPRSVLLIFNDTDNRDLHAIFFEHAFCCVYLRGRAVYRDDARHRPLVVAEAARENLFEATRIVSRLGGAQPKYPV